MNSYNGNAQDSKKEESRVGPNLNVLLTGEKVQSAYLSSAVDEVNRSNLTLKKQDSSPQVSRQSNIPMEFGIRTRVEVINDINSSFNNTILGGDTTPNYLNKLQSASPSKSPNRA